MGGPRAEMRSHRSRTGSPKAQMGPWDMDPGTWAPGPGPWNLGPWALDVNLIDRFDLVYINLSCQRQMLRSGPLRMGYKREDVFSVGVRSARFGKIRFD